MERLSENKIILVTRKTRLDELISRYNTVTQAKFYVEHMGQDFSDYIMEHENYARAVGESAEVLQTLGRVQAVDRAFLPNFIFGENDLVIAVGQDGLVANTMKYLNGQFLMGVNPDPDRWDGVLLPFTVKQLAKAVKRVFDGRHDTREVSLAKAELNDGQKLLAVNDFYIGQKTHVSSRYQISIEGETETQSSSGIIVSTGMGSTGWFKSILAGAGRISDYFSEYENDFPADSGFSWNSDFLFYTVREPYPSRSTSAGLVFGKITESSPLKIISLMGENGVIFSDGIENDYLTFNSGIEAEITLASHKGHLVV